MTILALLIGTGFIVAALFILPGTYYFTRYYWGPAIMTWFSGDYIGIEGEKEWLFFLSMPL